jgi:transcriptional regulator with XRE-family HTH domain
MRFQRTELRAIGRRIRFLREKRNWSLRRLSAITGISVAAIQKIEAGTSNPSLLSVASIMEALGASLDQLVIEARRPEHAAKIVRGSVSVHPFSDVLLSAGLDQPRMMGRVISLSGRERRDETESGAALFAYVLVGALRLSFQDRHREQDALSVGDSFHLAKGTSPDWINPLARRSVVLCLKEVNPENHRRSGARS